MAIITFLNNEPKETGAIITFLNNEPKETGQTLSSIAIATTYGIEHNLNILLVTTDFNDETVDSSYFIKRNSVMSILGANPKMQNDFSNGAEGLIRMFAANSKPKNAK